MEVLEERIEKRRENFSYYKKQLADCPGISFQVEPNDDYFSNHWLTAVLFDSEKCSGKTREDIRLYLESKNIESRPLWKPMHLQPIFAGCPAYTNGVSDKLFENGLCLPSSSNITDEERESVVARIKEIIF
jgi:dTDP-4-amino-4,6-dideoxygalactose transaminase